MINRFVIIFQGLVLTWRREQLLDLMLVLLLQAYVVLVDDHKTATSSGRAQLPVMDQKLRILMQVIGHQKSKPSSCSDPRDRE